MSSCPMNVNVCVEGMLNMICCGSKVTKCSKSGQTRELSINNDDGLLTFLLSPPTATDKSGTGFNLLRIGENRKTNEEIWSHFS